MEKLNMYFRYSKKERRWERRRKLEQWDKMEDTQNAYRYYNLGWDGFDLFCWWV